MTVLPARPAPTPAAARGSRLSTDPDRRRLAAGGLGAVIVAGLGALDDLREPGRDVTSGDLARTLHTAMALHQQRVAAAAGPDPFAMVAVALRIAGAHLDAGNLVDARAALSGAHDALPHRERPAIPAGTGVGDTDRAGNHARAVAAVQQRRLEASAVLAQAAGVLVAHTGATPTRARAALRRYAERHRFVLDELARDVVAGRMAPSAILGPALDSAERAPTVRRRRTT